ncbi:SDR family oxidoreductase [Roseicyclus mahoneyensis]|uniref:NAD(P)-dependent dehydrogenase (Short-subunit alcohol dehydrogenase family) n=1 Tax=Roseicyclus mahoneyensis TaxID=164332 RepID=A0A316GJL9_9RHOB|nr:SDR family oxidoreductase [Roseicyclus mahoneyensis]PWK60734.1 NAD(P)-dependent dehydrogenase (short-subunit alcohol dehydrogenase family) [Roseicyclus mahoneyensis]
MHVLITGANRGIGAGLAKAYRAEGAEVTVTARDAPGLVRLDVTDPMSVRVLADKLGDRALDLLICNAGVYLDKGHSLDDGFAPELWASTFAVNVTGVFLTVQALLPNLARAKAPKIAIIASQMGSSTRNTGGSYIYRASKAAAINLGRNLATDLKPRGIAVGIYHPGWVRTDMGGDGAEIGTEASVSGLVARIAVLDPNSTGAFETWDGRAHAF